MSGDRRSSMPLVVSSCVSSSTADSTDSLHSSGSTSITPSRFMVSSHIAALPLFVLTFYLRQVNVLIGGDNVLYSSESCHSVRLWFTSA